MLPQALETNFEWLLNLGGFHVQASGPGPKIQEFWGDIGKWVSADTGSNLE